ncbi:MAG: putative DNA binding domain-containing protein [Clostridia bacterium]|nr:putative DNA binding domain-containing protein [Clostridia bacterium]
MRKNTIIPAGESITVEFKDDAKKLDDSVILEVVVAFANTEGGTLYLGVNNDGDVTGLHRDHMDISVLSAFIANNTVPPVTTRAEIIDAGKPVLKLTVSKSYNGIVATISGKVYRRQIKSDGFPEDVIMYPLEYATRISELRLIDISSRIVPDATLKDFDAFEIQRLRRVINRYSSETVLNELSDEDLFKALGIVHDYNGDCFPTNAGIILIGTRDAIKRYTPTSMATFQVLEGLDVKVNDDMQMSLLAMIEKISDYMEKWNPANEVTMGMYRMSIPDFDQRAFREALVNAFSHRDYSKMGRVRVAVDDDGLTISNPGGFIEGISVNNLLRAEPHGRNMALCDILKRIGLAEKTGRGIDRIYEGSLKYGKALPDYSGSTSVSVSLFIHHSKPDKAFIEMLNFFSEKNGSNPSINTMLILNALKDSPRSNLKKLVTYTSLPESIIQPILDKLMSLEIAKRVDDGKTKLYSLSSKVYKASINQNAKQLMDESACLEAITNLAQENSIITKAEVMSLLDIGSTKAYILLKQLVDNGKLKMIAKGKYARYQYIG